MKREITMQTESKTPSSMTVRTLVPFLVLTFGLTWGIAALLILFSDQIVAIFGEITASNPLFILAVYSPGIVAVLLILRHYGLKGLVSFFRRLTLWRMSLAWWLFLILGIPVIFYAGAALKGTIGDPFPFSPWTQVFPALAFALFLGPIEEFGWRGLALPLFQRRFNPFWAGLILGIIWAVWHIPAFLLSGAPQSAWSFPAFFFGVVALSVILTPMFNDARGSLLIAVLYHFQMNSPIWPDAQPWDTLLFAIAAVIIVWLNRRMMFQHGTGVTTILMPEQGDTV
jgi:membrane protease YdiL (CAAX protease family)